MYGEKGQKSKQRRRLDAAEGMQKRETGCMCEDGTDGKRQKQLSSDSHGSSDYSVIILVVALQCCPE